MAPHVYVAAFRIEARPDAGTFHVRRLDWDSFGVTASFLTRDAAERYVREAPAAFIEINRRRGPIWC